MRLLLCMAKALYILSPVPYGGAALGVLVEERMLVIVEQELVRMLQVKHCCKKRRG